jgi:hypothetical protein
MSEVNLEQARQAMRAGALAAAKRLLGPQRERDAQAFADLVLARFDAITEAFAEFVELVPFEQWGPAVCAAHQRLMDVATANVSVLAVEALRIARLGSERGRQQ